MGKKYTPSGYQIITIDVSARTSGTAFTPETEDEKLLHEILSSGEIKKPILLTITGSPEFDQVTAFGVINSSGAISFVYGAIGSSTSETISESGDTLVWVEYVE